jgi:lipopolysaccharide exporter
MIQMSSPDTAKPGLAVQAFWLLIAKTTAFVLTLVMPIIMVRLFDPQQFGRYRLALVVSTTALSVLAFSVGTSAFYFLPRLPDSQRRSLIFNITAYHFLLGGLALATLSVWPNALEPIIGTDSLTSVAPLIGAMIAMSLFAAFFDTVATANQDVWHSTVFIVFGQLTRGIMIVGAAFYFRSVDAILWAWIIHGLLLSCVLFWYLHFRFPHFWRYRSKDLAVEQMRYVTPLGLTSVLFVIQLDIHNYIVSHSFSTAQYAFYAVGTSQIPLIAILRDSINSVMQSRISKLQQDNETDAMLRLTLRAWRTLALAFIPLFVGLLLLSEYFITALYTAKYADSIPIFRLNLLLLPLSIFVTDAIVRAYAEHRFWFLRLRIGLLVGQVLLSFLLIPHLGMAGALAAVIAMIVIDRILSMRMVFRTLGFRRQHLYIFRELGVIAALAVAAGGVMLAALAILPVHRPVPRLITGIAIYGISYLGLLASGFLNDEEKGFLNRIVMRTLRMVMPRMAARMEHQQLKEHP